MKQHTSVLSRVKAARIVYSFLLVTTFLWAIGLPILPIGNWVDTARAAAPTFTLKWKTASTKVVLTFDQWVFTTSASQQWGPSGGFEAADFVIGGASAPTITAVQADGGSKYVILTLSAAPTSGTTTFACAATAVYNQAAEACNSGTAVTAAGGNEDSTGPTISQVSPMGNKAVEVTFNEPVDKTTAETLASYTLVTAKTTDTTTISRVIRQPWDARMVRIEADGAEIDTSAGGADTMTVSANVKDVVGNSNQTTTAQTIAFSMTGAAMAPSLQGAYLENDINLAAGVDATRDRITLMFSKNMDETATKNGSYYTLKGYGADKALGGSGGNADCTLNGVNAGTGTPFNNADIDVDDSNPKKVYISVLHSQCDFTAGDFDFTSFDPTKVYDSIRVKNEMNGGGPKDTDGNIQMSDWDMPMEKATTPVVKGLGIDATVKTVTVRFDKNIDSATVKTAGFTVNTAAGGDDSTITAARLDYDQRSVVLTLTNPTFAGGDTVDILKTGANSIKDVLGNTIAQSGCGDQTTHWRCTLDASAPTITKVKATDTDGDKLLEQGETIAIEFSEEMDKFSAWDQWAFNLLYGATCAVTTPTTDKANCQWGSWGDSATSVWGSKDGGSTPNSKMTITLGTAPNIKTGYKIVPWVSPEGTHGVSDKAGNKVTNVATISLGSASIQSVKYTDTNSSSSVNATDTIKFVFTKSMDTATVTNANVNTRMVLSSSHSYGDGATVAWSTTTLTNDTLTVTLTGSGINAANNDTITPNAAVVDINGNSVSGTGTLKTAGPTVTSIVGLSTLKVVFTEAVLNTGGFEYPSQTQTITTYDASPVNLTDGTSDATQLQTWIAFGGGSPTLAAQALNFVASDGKTVVITLNRAAVGTDTLNVTGIKGVSGILASNPGGGTALTANYSATLSAGSAPKILRVEIMKGGGGGTMGSGPAGASSTINPGDILRIKFSGSMNPAGITTANIGTALRLCPVGTLTTSDNCTGPHSWGTTATGLDIRWFNEQNPNDVVEVVPGGDHTIANGDVIDPAATVTSESGTAVTVVGGDAATPAEGSTWTLDASEARVLSLKYNDADTSGTINVSDVVTFVFNKTMDTALDGNSADGCATPIDANNLELKAGTPSYQGFFVDTISGTTFTQRTNPWGAGPAPTMKWKKTTKPCDTLEIILGASPTIVGGTNPDNIWIDGGTVKAAGGVFVNQTSPLRIDTQAPTLTTVSVILDAGTANSADANDQLAFIFSEPMDQSTITSGNVATVLDSNASGADYGTSPTVLWLSPNIVKVTLGASPTVVFGTSTVNPTTAVKDSAGNIDATSTAPTATVSVVKPVSAVTLTDPDTTNPGLSKNDIRVTWTDSNATTGQYYFLYILPDTVPFSLATHKPFNSVGVNAMSGTSSYTYNATTSTFAIYDDSRFSYIPDGVAPPPGSQFNPLMPGSNYIAYVVTCDTINYACSGGTSSMPAGSTATQLIGEFKAFDATMLNQMQGTGSAAGAGAIFGGPIMSGGDFFVMGTMPYQGAIDVPTNIKLIGVKFSAPLDQSTMTASNIYLFNATDDPSAASKIAGTLAYSSGQSAVTFTPTTTLTASKKYRLVVTRSVKNSFGVPIAGMPQPGSTEPGSFMTDFKTGSGADSVAPQIVDNKIQVEGLTQASVSTGIPELGIRFNEDMDPTTFTSSSFLLQYDATYDGGDGFAEGDFATGQTPLTTVSGTVEYDPFGRVAHLWFNGTLPTQKDFRITLQGNTVKDIAGNYLDGDFDGLSGGNYTYVFATSNVADTTAPQISWADSDGFKLSVKFNAAMKKSTVTSASNWTLTGSSGVVSMSGAHIEYDAFDNSVHFDGLSLTENQQYTIAAGSNIKGLNNVAVDTNNNSKQFTVHGFSGAGAKGCTATGFEFGCGTNDAFNPNVMTFMPINVWPMNSFANQSSRYNISFPVTKAIASGGMIELVFPVGFDVSQAAQSNADTESFMNKDINGPGTGTVTIASVTGNASTRKVTIVTSGATQANDYLTFELKNIVNGPASIIDWQSNTGGHKIEITSKDNTSKTLEGPLSSMPFPLDKGGNGVISGKVTKTDGTTGIASAKIWLSTSRGGGFEKQTGSDGSFTFTGLPLPETGATANDVLNYWLNVEPPKSAGYLAGSSVEMKLSDETTSSTGNVIKIKQGSSVVSGKFSYNTAALNGKTVRLWASGSDGWLEYTFVLNGKTAGNDAAAACSGQASGFDACTNYSVNISDGIWNIGVDPYTPMNVGFTAGPPPDPEFMPPAAQNITVSGTGTANFSLSSASKTITGTVVDQNNTGLAGMQVWSYDPSGTNGFGSHTESKADGTFTLKVVPGVYKVGAGKPGMPPLSEQQVTVPATGTNTPSSLTFTFSKSDKTVKGIVLDESNNPIQFAGVNAFNTTTQEFVPAGTNNSGYYTLFLPQGTWKIEVRAPGYGRIKTDPSGADPTTDRSGDAFSYTVILGSSAADKSGYNFKAGAGNVTYKTITGSVKDSNNAGISGVMVWADEVDATGIFTGNGNGTQTDSTGAFSVKVPANCTGADNSACTTSYRLGAHVKGVGPLQQKTGLKLAAAGSALASQDWNLAATRSVTVKFYKGTIAAENLYAPAEAFVDAFNQSSNTGNNIRVAGVSSSTLELQESSYDVRAYIPGYGEVTPDSSSLTTTGSETKFVVSGNSTKTLIFAVSSNTITISGTATSGGAAIKNGWAHAFNRDTGLGNGDEIITSDSGVFSITVPAPATGSYELVVDAPGYSAFKQQSISTTTAAIAATLTQATSAISGTVYKSGGSTAEKYAQVWSEEIGGTGFATAAVSSNGTFSLAVESGKSYNISAGNKEGKKATNTSVAAGTTGTTLTLASTANVPGAALATAVDPKVDTVVPANGKVIDDTTNNDVKLNIEPQDLGSSSNSYSVEIESTPVMHETKSTKPFAKELDVSISDDTGKSLGLLNSTIDLTLQLEKSDVGTMITDDAALTNANIGSTLEKMELGYWDETKGNGTWMTSPTSTKVEVKNNSGDSYTVVDYDTFVTNIKSGSDNPNATGTNVTADYYADYKITMTTATNHLTTWGAIIQGSSDATAPSTPGSFAVSSAAAGSATLTWTASTDNVALHATTPYAIYRGTTSDFTPGTALASVNALTYSDSTVGTNSYTYYYRIRAQDTSANFSTASSAVTATYTAPSSVVPTSPASPTSPSSPTDTTAPTISNVKVVSQNTSATITWTTNEASQSWVVYGTTTGYGKEYKTTGMVTSHTAAITGLAPSTTYHYQVKAIDIASNMSTSADATFMTTSTATDQPIVKNQQPAQQTPQTQSGDTNLNAVKSDAATIAKETIEKIIQLVGKVRDLKQETSYEKSVVNKIVATVKTIKTEMKQKLVAFVTYGTPSTTVLGAGERGGVVNSFKEAFGKLPETEAEWEDVVKIANGRWPSKTSTAREDQAEKTFKKIYLRASDRDNPKDDAAVVVMAYGLRPKARNVDSERAAIKSFRSIFGKSPVSATDWDIVRAIAYSGAKR